MDVPLEQLKAGAVLYAKDPPRLSAFYAATIDFAVVHSEPDHVALESGTFEFVIRAVPDAIASSIEITTPPARREDTPIKLVFYVASIASSRETAAKLGGGVNPREREWRYRTSIVCDGFDPEGNVFQLREHAD